MFLNVQAAGSEPMAFRRSLRLGSLQGDRTETLEVEDVRIEGQIVPARDGH
ncbi:MAG: hypothetical protein HY509_04415, partial [Acidobacteria bacterium]|nr:hypothetical protein [Acidobacteriota bacterium]